jgi:tRNA(Arg) A34 adenosine deaminase TadA
MDEEFMRLAIEEAVAAERAGNRPFGAILVREGRVIGRGHNRCETDCDPTAHGEAVAIRDTSRALGTLTLDGATIYTTAEPCLLCTGAITYARIARVVIGAVWADAPGYFNHPEKGSLLQVAPHLTLPFSVTSGVLRDECLALYTSAA